MSLVKRLAALLAAGALLTGAAEAGPALLFEAASGKVLYAEDADNQWHPASLTKIMTAYIAFKDLKAGKVSLETKLTCSEAALLEPPSKVGLPLGAQLSLDVALKALIVKSANDVAVMIAETLGPTQAAFVERMNTEARKLGMTRTRFFNPNGLPHPEQVTTARDLAKLSRAIVTEFPEHAEYWRTQEFRIGKIRLATHNGLLKTFEGADGLKTGFICDSGYNVVASATRDNVRLMAVVLGEPSGADRTVRAGSLLEHGFQQLGWKSLFNTTTIDNMPVDSSATGVKSVRHTIASYSCGNQATARKLRAVRLRAKGERVNKLTKQQRAVVKDVAATAPAKTPAGKAATVKKDVAPPAKSKPATAASASGSGATAPAVKKSAQPARSETN